MASTLALRCQKMQAHESNGKKKPTGGSQWAKVAMERESLATMEEVNDQAATFSTCACFS